MILILLFSTLFVIPENTPASFLDIHIIKSNIFSEDSLLSETLIYRIKNEKWEESRKEIHKYYPHGNPKELLIQDMKEGKWVDYGKMTYTYDEALLRKKEYTIAGLGQVGEC